MVAIDNHGTKYLGPVQTMAAVSLNSLFNLNERITAQVVVAPDEDFKREMEYIALSYEMPLGTYGTELLAQASYSFTKPGYDLEQFDVEGKAAYWGITVSHPFVRTRNSNFTARFTYDMRNVDSTNAFELKREDNIRAARLGGKFEYLDNIFGLGFNVLDMELSQGLAIMGSNSNGDFMSRAGADPRFTKLNAEYQRLQRLFPQVNLLLGAKGQWASDALFSSEEFGLGGQSYGRGYDPSEVIGDSGFAGKAEVQWNDPVKFDGVVKTYQLYGFVDAGRVFNTDPGANALRTDTLVSVGLGVRAEIGTGTQAGLMVAKPMNRDVATMNDEDPRFYFNLNHRF
jgi:hemolysin activation/secretion protein